jgi:L-rhamnose-H+ transport protein
MIAPWVVSLLLCPKLLTVLTTAPLHSLFWSFFFGLLWGVGGLTFGLSMRYLGMSLGYALALGFCAFFGFIVPPIADGSIRDMVAKLPGQVVLLGLLICLVGIAACGKAGVRKEAELSTDEKKATISEFNFGKGLWVAIFAGLMSACMAFAIKAGKPIAEVAEKLGTPHIWQKSPLYIVIFAGGFLTNLVWCLILQHRNRSSGDYVRAQGASLPANYIFSALAGITWYLQFMFYGMGTTQMGKYDFSSWTIHMAFIIVFSNLWGIYFREWKGSSKFTHRLVLGGIVILCASTMVVGLGNWLAK